MEQNNVNTVEETVVEESTVSTPPAGFQVIVREFLKIISAFRVNLTSIDFLNHLYRTILHRPRNCS